MNKKFSVYFLRDPNDTTIRYVGITCMGICKRFSYHLYDNYFSHKRNWIRKLKNEGKIPICEEIVSGASFDEAAIIEVAVIAGAKDRKENLTNMRPGGELGLLGLHHSAETRQKISLGNKGKVFSKETRAKMRVSGRKRILSKESLDNLQKGRTGVGMRGKHHSEGTREKIRIANAGDKNGFFGKNHTETTREKMKLAWCARKKNILCRG
jgi:hypothetical protein